MKEEVTRKDKDKDEETKKDEDEDKEDTTEREKAKTKQRGRQLVKERRVKVTITIDINQHHHKSMQDFNTKGMFKWRKSKGVQASFNSQVCSALREFGFQVVLITYTCHHLNFFSILKGSACTN